MAGTPWSGCWGGVTGVGCGVGMASLGISWMQRYSLLSGTGFSSYMDHQGLQLGGVLHHPQSLFLALAGVFTSKVRHQQTPSQNERLLGCLGVKGEIGHWAVVKSAGSKEASVLNTEYTQIGLVIWGGSP